MSERADFSSEELAELAIELRTMWHAMVRGVHHTGPLEGLQRQQFWVLEALLAGPRRMSDLAEYSQTSQTSLTGIIDRLEERGLVERVRSTEDRRVVEVALTDLGRAEKLRAKESMIARLGEVLEPLTPAERRQFLRLVGKIADHDRTAARSKRVC